MTPILQNLLRQPTNHVYQNLAWTRLGTIQRKEELGGFEGLPPHCVMLSLSHRRTAARERLQGPKWLILRCFVSGAQTRKALEFGA